MSDDDELIPVMLPISVVRERAAGHRLGTGDVIERACQAALPQVTITIPVELRDALASRMDCLTVYSEEIRQVIRICAASAVEEARCLT